MNTSVSNYDGLRVPTLAVLLGSLPVNALRDVGYPGTSFEVLLVTAVAILLGSALGFLTKKSTVYFYILGLGAYAFVDTSFLNLATNQLFAAVLIIVLIIGAFRVLGDVVLPYILVFCIVFFGSSVIGERPSLLNITGGAPASEPAPDRSILHIVLDEQGSPFNVAYRPPENHPAAKILEDYVDWGFQVHSQVHSRTPYTRHTLSSIMALDPDNQKVQKNKSGAEFSYVAESNSYLEELLRQGYSVSVLQTTYIDFCLGNEAIRCATYSRVGHSSGFDDYGSIARFRIAFRSMLSTFRGPQRSNILLYRIADREIYARRPKLSNYLPLVGYNLLDERVFETASEIEPGEAYFVHLIFPHFPFLFDADCKKLPLSDIGNPVRYSEDADLEDIYLAYWDQVACAHKLVGRIVEETADKDFLTTVVHGDHGPRIEWITENENKDDSTKTFVALRSRNQNPSQDDSVTVLESLVVEYLKDHLGVR